MAILQGFLFLLEVLELWLSPSGWVFSLTLLWLICTGSQPLMGPIYEVALLAGGLTVFFLHHSNDL